MSTAPDPTPSHYLWWAFFAALLGCALHSCVKGSLDKTGAAHRGGHHERHN